MKLTKHTVIIISLILIIITIGIVTFLLLQQNRSEPEQQIQEPPVPVNNEDMTVINEIPWDDEEGIDLDSAEVIESQNAISTITSALPYNYSFTTEDGIDVEVSISSSLLEFQNWVLPISVYGPDYQVPIDDPEYEMHKKAFLEGASHALQFIESEGINTSDVIIDWGSREIVRNRALEWLAE